MKFSSTAGISPASLPSAAPRPAPRPATVARPTNTNASVVASVVASVASSPNVASSVSSSASRQPQTPTQREVVVERKPRSKPKAVGDDDGAPKKRVRLKPETPEQLIERLRNPQLSLHEASILLRVSRATVRRYADSGRLHCQRTPGGQRRFFLRDIENFYRQLKLKR